MSHMGIEGKQLPASWKKAILALGEQYDGKESTIGTPKVLPKLSGSSDDLRDGAYIPSDELAANEVFDVRESRSELRRVAAFYGEPDHMVAFYQGLAALRVAGVSI